MYLHVARAALVVTSKVWSRIRRLPAPPYPASIRRRDPLATRPTRAPAEAHVGPVFAGFRAGHRAGPHADRAGSGPEMTVRDQAEDAYRSMIDAGYGTSMAMRAYQTKMTTLPGVRIDGIAVRLLRPSSRWSHTRMAGEES
jgi:hypothetical protein